MKRIFTHILVAVWVFVPAVLPASQWSRTLGGPQPYDGPLAVREMADGTFVLAGHTDSFGTGTGDAWILRLDADGNLTDEVVWGNPLPDGVKAAAIFEDGSVVFVGSNTIDFRFDRDSWAHKIDPTGALVWSVEMATPDGLNSFYDVTTTADGGVAISGARSAIDSPPIHSWIVKLTADGTLDWQQKYDGGVAENANDIVQTSDGGYVVTGWTTSFGTGAEDLWVMKVDASGAKEWEKAYGGTAGDQGASVIELAGGGYAVAGWNQSFSSSGRAAWLVRLDASGSLLWHASMGDQEWSDFQHVVQTPGGELLATGRIGEPGFPTNDLWLVQLAPDDGTVLWQRAYEGDQGDWGSLSLPLADGGILVGGIWAWGFAEEDIWLLRTDALGQIGGCGLVRDTAVARTAGRLTENDGAATPLPPEPQPQDIAFTQASSTAATTTQCFVDPPCPSLTCDAASVDPDPVCEGEPQTFTVTTTGGALPLTREWDFDGDTVPDATGNDLVRTLPAGTHDVTVTVTDSCDDPPNPQSCSLQTTATVHPDQTPVIVPDGPTTFCAADGESVTLDAGPGHQDYQWARDGVDLPGADQQTLPVDQSGDYTVTVTDSNGCVWTSEPVTVIADACPCIPLSCDEILIDPDPVCVGESQTFTAVTTGGEEPLAIEWDFDGDTVPDGTANPESWTYDAGTWNLSVTVTDSCPAPDGPQSCSLQATTTVHPDQTPVIAPDGPTTFCAADGESVTLDAGAGYDLYQWARDGVDLTGADQQTLPVDQSGDYTVTVTDPNGCVWTSAPVAVDAEACTCEPLVCEAIQVEPDPVCGGEPQTFTVTTNGGEGGLTIEWDFDGDTLPDRFENPEIWSYPVGQHQATVTVTDSCPAPEGPGECSLSVDATVLDPTPPPEVSAVLLGAPPLLVPHDGTRLDVELLPEAVAYNLYVDRIGSWYEPAAVTGNICAVTSWTDNGDGTITFDADLPAGSWFLVTASTACAEGDAGTDSAGTTRMDVGNWELCGP